MDIDGRIFVLEWGLLLRHLCHATKFDKCEDSFTAQDRFVAQDKLVATRDYFGSLAKMKSVSMKDSL